MVLVAYQYANKRAHNSVTKKREKWAKLVAALNAKRFAKNSENEEEDIDNCSEKWEHLSTEKLTNYCEKSAETEDNDNDNDIINLAVPLSHNAGQNIEKKSLHKPVTNGIKSSQSYCLEKPSNNSMNFSSDIGKYELNEYKMASILGANEGNANEAEAIEFSNDENEIVKEPDSMQTKATLTHHNSRAKLKRPKENNLSIALAMQNVATAAQTTSELLARISKSTQKSDMLQQEKGGPAATIQATGTVIKDLSTMPQNIPAKLQQSRVIKILKDTATKITTPPQMADSEIPSLKQRNMELHRLRVLVERKRLQLLDVKLQREHEDMARDRIIFQREMKLSNTHHIRHNYEEKDI